MVKKALVGLWATCVCLAISSANTHAATSEVVLYTNDATSVNGTWAKNADTTAAGSQLWTSPDNGAVTSNPNKPKNYLEFTFNADANVPYHLWMRLRAA